MWNVEEFALAGKVPSRLATDETRWQPGGLPVSQGGLAFSPYADLVEDQGGVCDRVRGLLVLFSHPENSRPRLGVTEA